MRTVDDAVLASLRTVLTNVHDGQVPTSSSDPDIVTATLPYVVYYSNVGDDIMRRRSGRAGKRDVSFQVTYVGGNRSQAKWAGERARARLADKPLSPGGPRIRFAESQRVLRDNDATQPDGGRLFYGVDLYSVSVPIVTT